MSKILLSNDQVDEKSILPQDENPAYDIEVDLANFLATFKHFIVYELESVNTGTKLDEEVMRLVIYGSKGIDAFVKFIEGTGWFLYEDNYILEWWRFLEPKIKDIKHLPKKFVIHKLLSSVYQLFAIEYHRLQQPIGSSEFAKILGWKDNKFRSYYSIKEQVIPDPFINLRSTPIWTLGHVELFKRVLENREMNLNSRGDWKTQYIGKFAPKMVQLQLDENNTYFFNAMSSGRSIEYLYEGAFDESEELFRQIGDYLYSVTNEPIILGCMGYRFMDEGNLKLSRLYLEKALLVYENLIPEDFSGFFEVSNPYIGDLVNLAIVEAIEGNFTKAEQLLRIAKERAIEADDYYYKSERLRDVYTIITQSPEKFREWFDDSDGSF